MASSALPEMAAWRALRAALMSARSVAVGIEVACCTRYCGLIAALLRPYCFLRPYCGLIAALLRPFFGGSRLLRRLLRH